MRKKIIFWSMAILINLLLLISSFEHTVFDKDFYSSQYELNGVYDIFGKEKVDTITDGIFLFLHSKGELDSEFFNSKEIQHMDDVRGLFAAERAIRNISIIVFIVLLFLFFRNKDGIEDLSKLFTASGLVVVGSAALLLLAMLSFDTVFILFHKLLFRNNLWLLNPAVDNLIVLYPRAFFISISQRIFSVWLANGLLFIILGFAVKKLLHRKRNLRGRRHLMLR